MNLIEEIIAELKIKHGETKFEIEKIIDSQYKVLLESMQDRKDTRVINVMHIGKFRPTFYYKERLKRDEEKLLKEAEGDIRGMEESSDRGSGDRSTS